MTPISITTQYWPCLQDRGPIDCALPRNTGIFHNTTPNKLFLQRCTLCVSIAYLLARQRLRQQIFRLIKMHPWRNNLFLQRCTPVHSFSSLELGGWSSRYGIEPSSASMKKQPLHPRWGKNPCSKSRNPRRFFFFTSNVKQRILYSYIVAGWHSFVNSYFCTLTKECTNLQFGTLAWYPQTQRCLLWYPT